MKNKKVIIPIICAVLVLALVGSFFGIYFSRLDKVPDRIEITDRSSRFFSLRRTNIVAESPYDCDCVFETVEGLQNFYLKHRHNAAVVDIELHLTKDGKVVVFSDTLDTYSNAHILYGEDADISELTLEELKKINLAYNYADQNGQMFYKAYESDGKIDLVNILTLEEMISWFNAQRADLPLFAVRLSDADTDSATSVVDEVNRVFAEIGYSDFFFFCPENQSTADYIDEKYPEMIRSATEKEAKKLFKSCMTNKVPEVSFEIVYTNCDEGLFGKFSSEKFINYANNSNIALILRDVDESSVEALASLKVDGIATSDPATYFQLVKDERAKVQTETTPAE